MSENQEARKPDPEIEALRSNQIFTSFISKLTPDFRAQRENGVVHRKENHRGGENIIDDIRFSSEANRYHRLRKDHVSAIFDGLLGVKRAVFSSDSLAYDTSVLVHEHGGTMRPHGARLLASTSCCSSWLAAAAFHASPNATHNSRQAASPSHRDNLQIYLIYLLHAKSARPSSSLLFSAPVNSPHRVSWLFCVREKVRFLL